MANELRVRQNFLGGLIEDNPLTSGATTLTSAALAAMSAIGTTQHMSITLDPDGLYGEPEIVWVTAHTASATTATILRGQEGTTARAHYRDVRWSHGPSTQDFQYGLVPIEQKILAATGDLDFTNIPATYDDLILIGQLRSAVVSTLALMQMQFNGDTGNNYDFERVDSTDTVTTTGASAMAGASMFAQTCVGDSAPAGSASYLHAEIPAYRRTTFHKQMASRTGGRGNTSSGVWVRDEVGNWRSTAAINRIRLYTSSGANFLAGSVCTLYGRRAV